MTTRGKFFVIEGADGVGKSTAVTFLHNHLTNTKQRKAVIVRNPGETFVGQVLRNLIKQPEQTLSGMTIQLLMAADWNETAKHVVRPALDSGIDVVSDRVNYISGQVYYDPKLISALYEQVMRDMPFCDMLFVMFASAEAVARRLDKKNDALDFWDKEALDPEKHRKRQNAYENAATKARESHLFENVIKIDAEGSVQEVHEKMAHWADMILRPDYIRRVNSIFFGDGHNNSSPGGILDVDA